MDTTTPLPPADGPPGYQPPPIGPRRLTRSTDDRMIAGVCGGVADYLRVDPTIVRIGAIVLACFGVGIAAYLVGWVLIPEAPGSPEQSSSSDWLVPVSLLLVLGLFGFFSVFDSDFDFPSVALVLLGLGAVLVWGNRRDDGGSEPRGGPAPPDPGEPHRVDVPTWTATLPPPPPPPPPPPTVSPASPPAESRRRRQFPWRALAVAVGGLFIAAGVLCASVVLAGDIAPTVTIGAGLAALGAVMVVGAWLGTGMRALAPAGLLLLLGLAVVAIIDVPLEGGFADRTVVPETVAAIPTVERLTAGHLVIDLTDLRLTGDERLLEASVAAGELEVVVPFGTTVEVRAEVGAGQLDVLGQERHGLGAELDQVIDGVGEGRIELDLQVGAGHLEVRRRG